MVQHFLSIFIASTLPYEICCQNKVKQLKPQAPRVRENIKLHWSVYNNIYKNKKSDSWICDAKFIKPALYSTNYDNNGYFFAIKQRSKVAERLNVLHLISPDYCMDQAAYTLWWRGTWVLAWQCGRYKDNLHTWCGSLWWRGPHRRSFSLFSSSVPPSSREAETDKVTHQNIAETHLRIKQLKIK